MNIGKNDYVLGLWYCEKHKGEHPGYSIIIVNRNPEGIWYLNIRNHFKNEQVAEHTFKMDDKPSEDIIKLRVKLLYDVAKNFFPDFYEYIEVKGDYMALAFRVAMSEKLDVDFRGSNIVKILFSDSKRVK